MLQSLELFGFKSFADRTLFEFAPGITCVVGPNGSGKSNVVDAVKWILGDQSAKSLRGKDMADVIFNGSAGRRASGFAEATLTFDNSQGLLPLDTPEVRVGRRLYQSGDSEYLLNGASVRLKDVRDLLMGTGAGTAAYSIIEQGRVDQILQSNPTTRRAVFEEAAGISKFKARRNDAERRLERVAQNLLRLTDIVDQVESQLTATRSQATKAAKYRELSQELKQAWTGLAADDCRVLSAALDRQLNELEDLEHDQSTAQQDVDELHEQKQEIDARLATLDDQLLARERELSSLREAIASNEATIRYQSVRHEELVEELTRSRGQRLSLARQVDFARDELASTERSLADFEGRFETSRSQLTHRQQELERLQQLLQQRKQETRKKQHEYTSLQDEARRIEERIVVMKSQQESLAQQLVRADERCAALEDQLQAAEEELTVRQRGRDEAVQALNQRRTELTDSQDAQDRLQQQQLDTDRQLQQLRERRSAAEARLSLLDELEQRQEGITIGVREILQRAEASHYPPWNSMLGLVRDQIEVPLELAPVIDAALGERSQLIAMTHLDPLLDYLDRGAAPIDGRVGFISIQPTTNRIAPAASTESNAPDFTGVPGVYGRADQLVKERDLAKGLAARVLGDTWVVESLDVARRLLSDSAVPLRAVTLQGEVLRSNQQLHVGIMPHESSIISRKSELRQLKNEIHQLNRSIESATQRQSILDADLTERTDEVTTLSEELNRLSQAVTEATAQLTSQEREVKRLSREHQDAQRSRDQLKQQLEDLTERQGLSSTELSESQEAAAELAEILREQEQETSEAAELLAETQSEMKAQQLELATHEERLSNLRSTQARLQRDQQQRQSQLDDLESRRHSLQQSRSTCNLAILRAESEIASLALRAESIAGTTLGARRERDQLREERNGLARKEDAAMRHRRQLDARQHTLQMEIEKQRHQLITLNERITEEYQVSLEELVTSGVSAYHQFLEERYGSDAARKIIDGAADRDPAEEPRSEDKHLSPDENDESRSHREHDGPLSESVLVPEFEEVREELEARVDRLRRKLKMMGNVNTDALESLEELETRYATLSGQLNDLREAQAVLEDIIRRINHESQRIFTETFETIRGHFQELFRKLFGGGNADIILEDPDDVLECGIDIVARPPGKELRSISLLSGGEKTMTAVALLFAMFKSKPSPYCVLDEVDAALDEANVDRYVKVLKEFVSMTQFVVITHRKRTMTAADVLYGVTMEQAGVSKRISVRFEDVRDNGEIRTAA